jgi:hypothetical protein
VRGCGQVTILFEDNRETPLQCTDTCGLNRGLTSGYVAEKSEPTITQEGKLAVDGVGCEPLSAEIPVLRQKTGISVEIRPLAPYAGSPNARSTRRLGQGFPVDANREFASRNRDSNIVELGMTTAGRTQLLADPLATLAQCTVTPA